jgi:hypothetical protein
MSTSVYTNLNPFNFIRKHFLQIICGRSVGIRTSNVNTMSICRSECLSIRYWHIKKPYAATFIQWVYFENAESILHGLCENRLVMCYILLKGVNEFDFDFLWNIWLHFSVRNISFGFARLFWISWKLVPPKPYLTWGLHKYLPCFPSFLGLVLIKFGNEHV